MFTAALPSELWFIVFDLATFTPHSFDPGVYNNLARPRRAEYKRGTFILDTDDDMRVVRKALASKRAISGVCRAWHELVKPLLYEVVSLVRGPHVTSLAAQILPADADLVRYVRRLDVAVSHAPYFEIEDTLCDLIERLPSLEVFMIHGYHMSSGLMKALAGSNTIRKIVWEDSGYQSKSDLRAGWNIYNLIENTPQLATLLATPIRIRDTEYYVALTDVAAATSRMFTLPLVDPQNTHDVIQHRPGYPLVPSYYGFPVVLGDAVYVYYPLPEASMHIERLSGIRKIVFYIPFPMELTDTPLASNPFALPPGVTHICFHFGFGQASNQFYHGIRALLDNIMQLGYTFRIVRFLDERIVHDLTHKHHRALRRMHDPVWRLEDHLGRLLQASPNRQ